MAALESSLRTRSIFLCLIARDCFFLQIQLPYLFLLFVPPIHISWLFFAQVLQHPPGHQDQNLLRHGVRQRQRALRQSHLGKTQRRSGLEILPAIDQRVDFCHNRGVSHCNLKPKNLLLNENEDLKATGIQLGLISSVWC